jgi:MYXO-CTERM domain-containing protein
MNTTVTDLRRLCTVMGLTACLIIPSTASASEYNCNSLASLVLADEASWTCSPLAGADGVMQWPLGATLAVKGGECTACPTPNVCPDDPENCPQEDCDEVAPSITVYQDGSEIECEWVPLSGNQCSNLFKLSTDLEPGTYEIKATNGQDEWSWTVNHGESTEPNGSSDSGGDGCAASARATPFEPSFAPLWLLAIAAFVLLARRRSRTPTP